MPVAATDHPRACGANSLVTCVFCWINGSSPRMRGKRAYRYGGRDADRIIPAHAGQTACATSSEMSRSDHPRACGANGSGQSLSESLLGSSPRMRGKPNPTREMERRTRIIPAHAGQTTGTTRFREGFPDHPRACGANHVPQQDARQPRGSSPRMRGKLVIIFPRR